MIGRTSDLNMSKLYHSQYKIIDLSEEVSELEWEGRQSEARLVKEEITRSMIREKFDDFPLKVPQDRTSP